MKCSACGANSCIREVPVFRGLPEVERKAVEAIVDTRHYMRGSVIFREGEPSDSLYIVRSGLIKLTQGSKEGKQHVLRFLFPGDYFGQFALLHQKKNYVNAEVVEGGGICRIHRDDFLPLLEQSAALSYRFLMSLSEQLHQADEQAGAMHILEVEKRLARLILYLYSRDDAESHVPEGNPVIQLPAAKKEVAAMIGTSAETLSRKLGKFEAGRMIAMRRRTVEILDMGALRELAEHAY